MKVLRITQVCETTGLSPASVYKAMRLGLFPRNVAISARARGWIDTDIEQWIEGKKAQKERGSAK